MSKDASRAVKPRRGGRPRTEEKEQREEYILQIAGETFLKFGFDGTTMDTVAEAARMSKRTLYTRYPDKGVLFHAVLHDLINRWLTPIDQFQLEQGDLKETLLMLARHMATFALTPQSINVGRIIISEAQRQPEFGRLANEAGRKPAIRMIASILRRHHNELRPVDLDMAAAQFLSLVVDSNLQLAYLGIKVGPRYIEKWVRTAVDLFLAGARRRDLRFRKL